MSSVNVTVYVCIVSVTYAKSKICQYTMFAVYTPSSSSSSGCLEPRFRGYSRQRHIQLTMREAGCRHVQSQVHHCLPLRFVDGHGESRLHRELLASQTEREAANVISVDEDNSRNQHVLSFTVARHDRRVRLKLHNPQSCPVAQTQRQV